MICCRHGIERAEEGRRVFGAHALAVLAPQHAAVLPRQRRHLVGDLADQRLLRRVRHVDRRADVQHAGIDVAEHAVDQTAAVQRRAELGDVVGEVLGRHRRVLDEGDGPAAALHVAEKADGLLAHAPDALDGFDRGVGASRMPSPSASSPSSARRTLSCAPAPKARSARRPPRCCAPPPRSRHGEAAPPVCAALPLQLGRDPPELGLEVLRVVGQQLDQVHALGRALGVVGEELADLLPRRCRCERGPAPCESTVSMEAACTAIRARASRSAASKLS